MAKKKRLFSFRLMPGSWGLVGQVYDEAEAHYYLSGEELDRALVEIRNSGDEPRLKLERLKLDLKYGLLTEHEYDLATIADVPEGVKRELALLDIEYKHGKIDEKVFEKSKATLLQEPWVDIVDEGFDPLNGTGIGIDINYNSYMILFLRQNGFAGDSDEDVIENWFSAILRQYSKDAGDLYSGFSPMVQFDH